MGLQMAWYLLKAMARIMLMHTLIATCLQGCRNAGNSKLYHL